MCKKFQILVIFVYLSGFAGFSQSDTSRTMIQYSKDFHLNEGVYLTFAEFKSNAPQIREYDVSMNNANIDGVNPTLTYKKSDSTGKKSTVEIKQCFAFCKNGIFYLNAGNYGFYRTFILGALTHYVAYYRVSPEFVDFYAGSDISAWSGNDMREFVLDFETGDSFLFTYIDFKKFLANRDPELYKEMEHTHGKRKLIHRFLLKYNERHPIYFPESK
jgi:hypothetical protein